MKILGSVKTDQFRQIHIVWSLMVKKVAFLARPIIEVKLEKRCLTTCMDMRQADHLATLFSDTAINNTTTEL